MKTVKIFTLISLLSLSRLIACGGGEFNTFKKDNYYNFLESSLINLKQDNPLYNLSTETGGYYDRVEHFTKIRKKLNIEEWQKYLKNSLSKQEVESLIYNKEKKLLAKVNNKGFEKYLNYVHQQESNVQGYYSSEEEISNQKLIEVGEKLLKEERDSFLKLRYLFLVMRLEHYSENYIIMLNLYKQEYPTLAKVDSIVVEWIDALRAGAWQHRGEDVKSNLLYGEILKNNKSNPDIGYYDFKIHDDEEWKNLLSHTKSPEHKALFYFLRALKWKSAPLMEHAQIAKIAPNSIWFDRLSYMILQDLQQQLFQYSSTKDKTDKYTKANYESYRQQKEYFFKTLSSLEDPSFLSLYAQLYLNIIEHKEIDKEKFRQLKNMATADKKIFVETLHYLNNLSQLDNIKQKDQEKLFGELRVLFNKATPSQRSNLLAYTAFHLSPLYPDSSPSKLILELYSKSKKLYRWDFMEQIDEIRADDFEKYIEKRNRSYFEEKIFRSTMGSLEKGDIAKILATLNIKERKFQKAQKYLNQIPSINIETEYNPFNVFISGNNRESSSSSKSYTQRKFVKTMLKIQTGLDKNPTDAMGHFLYATGLYNSTWFGNFPMSAMVYRHIGFISDREMSLIENRFDEIEKEYKLALKYTDNREFKAKISYQLLKIQSSRLLRDDYYYDMDDLIKTIQSSKSFAKSIDRYKTSYEETNYGQEVIKKCATFSYFK